MTEGSRPAAAAVDGEGGPGLGVDDDQLRLLLGRRRLRFPEPLETAFREDFAHRWLGTNRGALWIGIVIYAALSVLDLYAAPESFPQILLIRAAFVVVAGVLFLVLTYRPAYLRWMQQLSCVAILAAGLDVVLMELVLEPDEPAYGLYIFAVTAVISYGYAAPRLRLFWASVAGWLIVLGSMVVAVDHALADPGEVARLVTIEAFIVVTNAAGMLGAYFIESGDRRNFLQELRVQREQERSRALMLNILPEAVADRLMTGDEVVDGHEDVTVLFADIVGFTPMSAGMTPHRTVAILNEVFSRFDRLAERHGLEKIKTIGDEYMVVGGLPEPSRDHAERVAAMALEMQEATGELSEALGVPIALRIGIHAGPVVAGVIGLRKFSYDLWGDTVNTASRMESHAEPGKVLVTEAVFERLRRSFRFSEPGTTDVKGKGHMRTYALMGRR